MAGRKPKPTAIKKLEGNPGKRKLNRKVTRNIKKSTTGKTKVFKIGGKKLNRKKDIRVYVSAYKMIDGKKVILANSKVATLKAKRNSK